MKQSIKESLKVCFNALEISDFRAYDILFAELMRIGNDERLSEDKKIIILTQDKSQVKIINAILEFIKKEIKNPSLSLDENIDVRTDPNGLEEIESENVIDFCDFDYEKEKSKLIQRCNSTILGNDAIRNILIEQEGENVADYSKFEEETARLNEKLEAVESRIDRLDKSPFADWMDKKIENLVEEGCKIRKELQRVKKKQKQEKDYEDYVSRRRTTRIVGIAQKEDTIQGIKFIFTNKRERLVKTRDEEGNLTTTFVEVEPDGKRTMFEEPDIEK